MIMNNIQTVFTKLINEGKTTIRLKEPDHDICIKGKLKINSEFETNKMREVV